MRHPQGLETPEFLLCSDQPVSPLFTLHLGISEELLKVFEKYFIVEEASSKDNETFHLCLRYLASLYSFYTNTHAFPSALLASLPNKRGVSVSRIRDWMRGVSMGMRPRRRKEVVAQAYALVVREMRSNLKRC